MSILTSLLEKIEKEKVKEQSAKTKLLDFEKMIADQARANGLQPRTYLEQLCKQSESFASSKLVKVLLGEKIDEGRLSDMMIDMEADASAMSKEEFIKAHGEKYAYIWDRVQAQERGDTNEQDVPTQKGRDAKRDVLTPKAMHKVKQGIKQAAKKQRRRMDKDAVDEGAVKDYLMDLEDDATKMSKDEFVKKHGEGKANIWDKVNSPDYNDISDLMDGNEFAKKVTDLKAKGAKPGTKFKTSDGKEHTLEDLVEKMMLVRDQVAKAVADKVQDWAKGASIDQINKVLAMIKSGAKLKPEGPQSASIEEDAGDDALAKEIAKLYDYTAEYIEDSRDNDEGEDDEESLRTGYDHDDLYDAENLADAFRKNLQAGLALHKKLKMKWDSDSVDPSKGDWDPFNPEGIFYDEMQKLLAKHGKKIKGVKEDAITEEQFEQLAEKKDACYYKVKSRYKVWPSAYASGALVQCRKVGAKNWGNKSKK